MTDKSRFVLGDWIRGKTRQGELIHGFIEFIDESQGIVKVFVINSDQEGLIGKSIWMQDKWIVKLPTLTDLKEYQLNPLIDLSLQTKDEQWFMELTTRLRSIQNSSQISKKKVGLQLNENTLGSLYTNKSQPNEFH